MQPIWILFFMMVTSEPSSHHTEALDKQVKKSYEKALDKEEELLNKLTIMVGELIKAVQAERATLQEETYPHENIHNGGEDESEDDYAIPFDSIINLNEGDSSNDTQTKKPVYYSKEILHSDSIANSINNLNKIVEGESNGIIKATKRVKPQAEASPTWIQRLFRCSNPSQRNRSNSDDSE